MHSSILIPASSMLIIVSIEFGDLMIFLYRLIDSFVSWYKDLLAQ